MPDSKRLSLQIGALLSRKKECAMNETGRKRGVLGDFHIQAVIDRLHDKAEAQRREPSQQHEPADADERKRYLSERYVALDREKAEFCYLLCRSMCARHVVEAGTSFGVSTIYLATAVRDNGGGTVIATEYEQSKAKAARRNFAEAGIEDMVDLREGDLRDTLRTVDVAIDFMLIDIWTPMARPALELVAPRLRRGAVVMCDNTLAFAEAYRDYRAFIDDPANGFSFGCPSVHGRFRDVAQSDVTTIAVATRGSRNRPFSRASSVSKLGGPSRLNTNGLYRRTCLPMARCTRSKRKMQSAISAKGIDAHFYLSKDAPRAIAFYSALLGTAPARGTDQYASSILGIIARSEFQWCPLRVGSPLVALCSPSTTSRAHSLAPLSSAQRLPLKRMALHARPPGVSIAMETHLRFIIAKVD